MTLVLIWLVPFLQIWVVFGAANQLMASLALLLVTLWLMSKGKSYQWTLWPFVFMFVTTIGALFYKAYEAFFINLPKTGDPVANKIANVGEYHRGAGHHWHHVPDPDRGRCDLGLGWVPGHSAQPGQACTARAKG